MDFLQERTFNVEVDGVHSDTLKFDRGCVQGSSLGPRLFMLYVGTLEDSLKDRFPDTEIISYADDTYVLVPTWDTLGTRAAVVIEHHVPFLKDLGMTVKSMNLRLKLY